MTLQDHATARAALVEKTSSFLASVSFSYDEEEVVASPRIRAGSDEEPAFLDHMHSVLVRLSSASEVKSSAPSGCDVLPKSRTSHVSPPRSLRHHFKLRPESTDVGGSFTDRKNSTAPLRGILKKASSESALSTGVSGHADNAYDLLSRTQSQPAPKATSSPRGKAGKHGRQLLSRMDLSFFGDFDGQTYRSPINSLKKDSCSVEKRDRKPASDGLETTRLRAAPRTSGKSGSVESLQKSGASVRFQHALRTSTGSLQGSGFRVQG